MYFDFFYTYTLRALILPSILAVLFLVAAISCAVLALKANKTIKTYFWYACVAVFATFLILQMTTLFSGGFGLLSEHLDDATIITGEITETYDEGQFLCSVIGDEFIQNDGNCVSLKINGTNYIAPAMVLEQFNVGDTVTISALPESKFIITIVKN